MTIGPDIEEVLEEVGTSFKILYDSGAVEGGFLDFEPNSQVTKPFIREFFLEAMLSYNTSVVSGDVIQFDTTQDCYMVMNFTPSLFENTVINFDAVLYKTNVHIDLYRPTVVSQANYHDRTVWTLVKANVKALMTSPLYGSSLDEDRELGALGLQMQELYIPMSVGIQTFDKMIIRETGEHWKVDSIKARRFLAISVAELGEDTREWTTTTTTTSSSTTTTTAPPYTLPKGALLIFPNYDSPDPPIPDPNWETTITMEHNFPTALNIHLIMLEAWNSFDSLDVVPVGAPLTFLASSVGTGQKGAILCLPIRADGTTIYFNSWTDASQRLKRLPYGSPLSGPWDVTCPPIVIDCLNGSIVGSSTLKFDGIDFEFLPTILQFTGLQSDSLFGIASIGGDISLGAPCNPVGDVTIVLTNEVGGSVTFVHTQLGSHLIGKFVNVFNNPPNQALYTSTILPIITGHICSVRASVSGNGIGIVGFSANTSGSTVQPVHSNIGESVTLEVLTLPVP